MIFGATNINPIGQIQGLYRIVVECLRIIHWFDVHI